MPPVPGGGTQAEPGVGGVQPDPMLVVKSHPPRGSVPNLLPFCFN